MRIPPKRIDHVGLLRDYGGQDFLLFALRHIAVVERSGNLRSDLVELFGCDVEILVGFAQLLTGVFKGPADRLAKP
jgi:hypothetical protein